MKPFFLVLGWSALVLGLGGQAAAEMHEFTSTDGRKLKAELLDYAEKKVTLKTESGQTVQVDLLTLSEPDREYIDLWATDPARVPQKTAEISMADYLTGRGYEGIPYSDEKLAMMIEVTINERPHHFMINTALPYSYIDGTVADVLGLKVKQIGALLGTLEGGQVGVGEGALENFTMGKTVVTSRIFRVANLTLTGINNSGIQVDGVLGFDFLQEFGVVVDYKAKVLYFVPPAQPK